jgi:hypothetical protein
MRKLLSVAFLLAILHLFTPSRTLAAEKENEPYSGAVLCTFDRRAKTQPDGCPWQGAGAYLARMMRLGVYPRQPLPGKAPDPALTLLDIRYGQVKTPDAPVYASLQDALERGTVARRIDSPYSFISYTDEAVIDGKRFYQIEIGGWMTANDVSRIGALPTFQGLTFDRTPQHAFGWILYPLQSKRTPGFAKQDYLAKTYSRYQVVRVYAAEVIEDMEWYMIGAQEWIPEKQDWRRLIGRVLPNPQPPKGVENGRWVEINLHEQTIAIYDNRQLVYASLVASGIEPFWTRPGLFQIYRKLPATLMRGAFEADRSDAYYLEDVPWTMYFDKARALHGAYWHNGFGAPRSHGCVNLSVGDARWIFDWATEGDWVYVWDPSGETPTDPAMYGEGGA